MNALQESRAPIHAVMALPILLIAFGEANANEKKDNCIYSSEKKCLKAKDIVGLIDYGPPSSPLFTLMNATPETVLNPLPTAEWAISAAPQVIDAFGNEPASVGLSFNPGLLALGEEVVPQDLFNGNKPTTLGFLTRVSVMGAVIREGGDDSYSTYGLGVGYTFDTKSPLVNFAEFRACNIGEVDKEQLEKARISRNAAYKRAISSAGLLGQLTEVKTAIEAKIHPKQYTIKLADVVQVLKDKGAKPETLQSAAQDIVDAQMEIAPLERDAQDGFDKCLKTVNQWNRPLLALGAAAYYTDFTAGGSQDGFGLWGTYSFPFPIKSERGQATITGRIVDDLVRPTVLEEAKGTDSVDAWSVGARYTYELASKKAATGNRTRFTRGFVEAGYTEETFNDDEDEFWQVGLGAEVQVSQGLFLQFVVGDTLGSDYDRSGYLSAQLNWSLTKAPVR